MPSLEVAAELDAEYGPPITNRAGPAVTFPPLVLLNLSKVEILDLARVEIATIYPLDDF
jgi:hypothetical protein